MIFHKFGKARLVMAPLSTLARELRVHGHCLAGRPTPARTGPILRAAELGVCAQEL